jgi:Fur family zinc uptake transcriptional regulator
VTPVNTLPSKPFPDQDHNHRRCVERALDEAESQCQRLGVRMTELRRRVLELVWGGHRPVGAYEILAALGGSGRPAQPPTVYRALDFLLRHGFVHRIERLNSFVGCSRPGPPHQGQFLICRTCGRAAELVDSGIEEAIRRSAVRAGFDVERRNVEVTGLCADCRMQEGSVSDA